MNYGDLGKRILAWFIDAIIISAISFVFGYIMYYLGLAMVAISVAPLISLFYYVIMEGGSLHATIGKRIMNLYVADSNGDGVTFSAAFIRNICKIISGLVFGIGYIVCFFNGEKQCIHDMLAKTYVLEGNAHNIETTPKLVCIVGPLAGAVYNIPESGLLIGRDSMSCQVVIPASQKNISRNHCFVIYNGISDMFIISDRKSTYGTYLSNGRKIEYSHPAAVRSGARFYLATSENMFEVR